MPVGLSEGARSAGRAAGLRVESGVERADRRAASLESAMLWEAYRVQGDVGARDELLSRHLRLVHHVARDMIRKLRVEVEFDDLVSAGTLGLVAAVESFDPARGLAFSTYAAPRIRGAILDDLRRWDHVPRSVRRKQRQIAAARDALMSELHRVPEDRETAAELGIDVEKLWRWQADAEDAGHVSLDRPVDEGEGRGTAAVDLLAGATGEEIEAEVNFKQEVGILREAVMRLKEQERTVLVLYYYEELKLHEIASILGLTESRVSQIRSKALQTLRSRSAGLRA